MAELADAIVSTGKATLLRAVHAADHPCVVLSFACPIISRRVLVVMQSSCIHTYTHTFVHVCIREAPWQPAKVVYGDTDSMFVCLAGRAREQVGG